METLFGGVLLLCFKFQAVSKNLTSINSVRLVGQAQCFYETDYQSCQSENLTKLLASVYSLINIARSKWWLTKQWRGGNEKSIMRRNSVEYVCALHVIPVYLNVFLSSVLYVEL